MPHPIHPVFHIASRAIFCTPGCPKGLALPKFDLMITFPSSFTKAYPSGATLIILDSYTGTMGPKVVVDDVIGVGVPPPDTRVVVPEASAMISLIPLQFGVPSFENQIKTPVLKQVFPVPVDSPNIFLKYVIIVPPVASPAGAFGQVIVALTVLKAKVKPLTKSAAIPVMASNRDRSELAFLLGMNV